MERERGYNIIELLIAMAGSTVVLGVVAHLLFSQVRQAAKFRDATMLNSVQLEIQRALLNPQACVANFPNSFRIDETRFAQSNYQITLDRLVADGSGADVIIRPGESLLGLSPDLRADRIVATSFKKIGANRIKFDLNIPVSDSLGNKVGEIRVLRIRVSTDPASLNTAQVVVNCGFVNLPPRVCRVVRRTSPNTDLVQAACDANEILTGGGGECLTPSGDTIQAPYPPANTIGYLYLSRPVTIGATIGWEADCFNETTNAVRARAYAYCCNR